MYEHALSIWRGGAYFDFVEEWWARSEVERLEELRLIAAEERFEWLLQLGDHAEAVAELQGLVASQPRRPRLVGQLMVALDATGREAEAHRVYRAFHAAVRDLGLDPSADLLALDRSIAVGHARSEQQSLTGNLGIRPSDPPRRPEAQVPPQEPPTPSPSSLGRAQVRPLPRSSFVGHDEDLHRAEVARMAPLPARLAVRPAVRVVGRSAELVVVGDCVKRVGADGGREVVVVSGEAGVGKTTLIAEAARVAFDGGACVLFGHCEEDLATPYQLFAEALGHFIDQVSGDELVDVVGGDGAVLARLLTGLERRLPGIEEPTATDADAGRYQLFAAVAAFLARLSAQQPVVLVLEDLQWADRASLQLLRHVVGSDRPTRLVVIGSFRDSELSRSHPMVDTLAELHRLGIITRVELVGLDAAGVAAFIEAAGGHAVDEAALVFAAELHRETGGNPFFVGEVLDTSPTPAPSHATAKAAGSPQWRSIRCRCRPACTP